ncbi:methyltransferase family protein [Virgibacillus siamensis]|uniref:methyltransferase family protein n=1 Tax=Virgibacillus siamensis TaxID=480071 RepID=UPI0009875C3C|nr:isoprenylcysteine carboxylmethyltransferase family protein [Virgibacillus siamensis]
MGYFAITTLILVIIMVLSRVAILRVKGIEAMKFGEMDKKDYIAIPFVLLYFYIVLTSVIDLPALGTVLFKSMVVSWIGIACCTLGFIIFLFSLIAFGKSFRVGIDENHPDELVTSGVFSISRNPIYTAFLFILIGVFLIIPNWILLLYFVVGFWFINRQVRREEDSLEKIYGNEYKEYCKKVRRYL